MNVPHRPPMLFVCGPVRVHDGATLVDAIVRAGSPAAEGASVRPAYLIEIAAQAAAASRAGNGEAMHGMLIGVRDWRMLRPVSIDAPIIAKVRSAAAIGNLRQFEAELTVAGAVVAQGTLQVMERPE